MLSSHPVLQDFASYTSILAIFMNLILIKLIISYSHSSIGTYKYLMVYVAVFELTFGFVSFVHLPIALSKDSGFFVLSDWKHSILPRWLSALLNVTYHGFYGFCLVILAIHFIYRYAAVSGHQILITFTSWKLLIWLSLPFLNGVIWTLVVGLILVRDKVVDEILIKEFLGPRGLKLEDYEYFASIYYIDSFWIVIRSVIGSVIITSLILFSSFIMIFFGWKCYNSLKLLTQMASKSENYRNLQNQLFYALVAQTLVPTVFLHFPSLLLIISLIMNASDEWYGDLLCLATAIYPAVNPIPTILIVESYRKGLIRSLGAYLRCQKGPEGGDSVVAPMSLREVKTRSLS